jgi:hypothetical protein
MSGKSNEIDQPQRKGGDRVQESQEKPSSNEGLSGIDRINLLKLWTPTPKDAPASYLPSLSIDHGPAKGNAAQPEAGTVQRTAERTGADSPGILNDRIAKAGYRAPDSPAQTYELNNLKHRSGDHHTPDAIVRMPQNFDPSKPIHVVIYNHGYDSNARSAYMQNKLGEHMKDAPPNTVLIVPEWQQSASTRSPSQGQLEKDGMYKGMLQEVFDKTPGLQGKTLNDVDGISILAHSAGNMPALKQIYNNGLGDKVKSITLLDALYNNGGHNFDRWLQDNIKDLGEGKKQFNNFFNDTSENSKNEAQRVKNMLLKAGMPASSMVQDYSRPGTVMDSGEIAKHSIVFKFSNATEGTFGPHWSMPGLYVGQVEKAAALKSPDKPEIPSDPSGKLSRTGSGDKPADRPSDPQAGGGKPSDQPPVPQNPSEKPADQPPAPENPSEKPATPPDKVPAPGSPQSRIDESRKILENPEASIQQKMSACAELYNSLPKDSGGRVHVTLNDGGKQREFEISQHSHGQGVLSTQLFARDSANHEHPVLRFVERHNKFEQQRDAHGTRVSYQGKWWEDHEKSSTVGRASHDGKPAPVPPEPEKPDKPIAPKPNDPSVSRLELKPVTDQLDVTDKVPNAVYINSSNIEGRHGYCRDAHGKKEEQTYWLSRPTAEAFMKAQDWLIKNGHDPMQLTNMNGAGRRAIDRERISKFAPNQPHATRHSTHEDGISVDVANSSDPYVRKALTMFGFVHNVPGDRPHFTYYPKKK